MGADESNCSAGRAGRNQSFASEATASKGLAEADSATAKALNIHADGQHGRRWRDFCGYKQQPGVCRPRGCAAVGDYEADHRGWAGVGDAQARGRRGRLPLNARPDPPDAVEQLPFKRGRDEHDAQPAVGAVGRWARVRRRLLRGRLRSVWPVGQGAAPSHSARL